MNLHEKIGTAANCATIALVVLLSIVLVREGISPVRTRASARSVLAQPGTSLKPSPLKVDWASNKRTVVLGLQTTCHFCSESAPFLRRVVKAAQGRAVVVAVLPQPLEVSKLYLDGLGVAIGNIKQATLSSIGVAGTPTIMLVDGSGIVRGGWVGKVAPDRETEVLDIIAEGAQSDAAEEKTVHLERFTLDDPVRIIAVMEGEQQITPVVASKHEKETPFQAGDDWLNKMTIIVRNMSGKEVIAAHLLVDFPQTGAGVPDDGVVAQPIWLGRTPERALYDKRNGKKIELPTSQPLHLMPGQELKISLSPYYGEMTTSIERKLPVSQVTSCWIRLQQFYFADGTRWAPGNFQKPDPNVPGKYLTITPDEFKSTLSSL